MRAIIDVEVWIQDFEAISFFVSVVRDQNYDTGFGRGIILCLCSTVHLAPLIQGRQALRLTVCSTPGCLRKPSIVVLAVGSSSHPEGNLIIVYHNSCIGIYTFHLLIPSAPFLLGILSSCLILLISIHYASSFDTYCKLYPA